MPRHNSTTRNRSFETLEFRRVLAAPTAVDDSFSPYRDELLDVLANDSDPDSSFQIVSFTQPGLGQISLYVDNDQQKLRYQSIHPGPYTESFTYTISDGAAQSTATVTVFNAGTDRFSFTSVPYIGVPGQLMSYTIS